MGINFKKAHHKDSQVSEKHEVREERSDSEDLEHGELLLR